MLLKKFIGFKWIDVDFLRRHINIDATIVSMAKSFNCNQNTSEWQEKSND
jgi:hypothetical protein